MDITTKYNIGAQVIGISHKRTLKKFKIAAIDAHVKNDGSLEIVYNPSDGNGGVSYEYFEERYCFDSIDQALAYIKSEIS